MSAIVLILYYGLLVARAALRRAVVARAPEGDPRTAATALLPDAVEPVDDARPPATLGRLWAELMRRTFRFGVLACPRCGGRLRLVALIEEARVIARILGHLGLPTGVPEPCVARAPRFGDGRTRVSDGDFVFDPGSSAQPVCGASVARCAGGVRADQQRRPCGMSQVL